MSLYMHDKIRAAQRVAALNGGVARTYNLTPDQARLLQWEIFVVSGMPEMLRAEVEAGDLKSIKGKYLFGLRLNILTDVRLLSDYKKEETT